MSSKQLLSKTPTTPGTEVVFITFSSLSSILQGNKFQLTTHWLCRCFSLCVHAQMTSTLASSFHSDTQRRNFSVYVCVFELSAFMTTKRWGNFLSNPFCASGFRLSSSNSFLVGRQWVSMCTRVFLRAKLRENSIIHKKHSLSLRSLGFHFFFSTPLSLFLFLLIMSSMLRDWKITWN